MDNAILNALRKLKLMLFVLVAISATSHPTMAQTVVLSAQQQIVKRIPGRMQTMAEQKGVMPNDPYFINGFHWSFLPTPVGMNAIGAWKRTTGDRQIVVAVVGTGLLASHPDIVGSGNILRGYSFVSVGKQAVRGADTSDPSLDSAGTNAASIIGAVGTNNGIGVSGINWAISILPVRVVSHEIDVVFPSDIIDGIRWAAGLPVEGAPPNPNPADVIDLGFAMSRSCEIHSNIGDAILAARAAGAVLVAGTVHYADVAQTVPAGCPGVVSVAAHNDKGSLSSFSGYGQVSIMAPGGEVSGNDGLGILSPNARPTLYESYAGTAQASAHVSAAIALALSVHQEWRRHPEVVEAAIRDTAVPVRPGACPKPCGPGQLDALRLIEYVPSARTASRPAAGSTDPRPEAKPLFEAIIGRWMLDQGDTIVIAGGEWFHPKNGSAIITIVGQDELLVQYPQQTGVRCTYRALFESQKVLKLVAKNLLQPDEFCPSGRLTALQ